MSDNIAITPGSGAIVATDEITINAVAVQVPWGKLGFGADGTFTVVTSTVGLPVNLLNTSLPLPTGASTEATLSTLNGKVTACNTGAVVVSTLPVTPAGTNLIGQVAAGQQTNQILSGTTALIPKFATIVASSSGATTIVAAVSTKKIRVLRFSLSASAAVNVKFQSHVTPTDLTGLLYLGATGGAGGTYCPIGLFETIAGEALDINLSGAIPVGGFLTYIEV